MLKVLDLFSGIGGFSLGLESAGGFKTASFCENDSFCQQVLAKHWPGVPIYDDIADLTVDISGNLIYIDKLGGVNMGKKKDAKYNHAVELYNTGASIQDCADFYGITRQAMYIILKRRGIEFRPNLKYGKDNHFYRDGKGKIRENIRRRAGHLVEKAIKKGILIPRSCEVCHASGRTMADGKSRVQAHHDDYSRPLEVRWLCQQCHHEWHQTNVPKGDYKEPAGESIDVITGGFP